MFHFIDKNGNQVKLTYERGFFSMKPQHVLIICRFQNQWLLTKHPKRGLEFPGGKLELNESIEEAAKREVFEETGGIVGELTFIGEYMVEDRLNKTSFAKAIFFAEMNEIIEKDHYEETEGPQLVTNLTEEKLANNEYSFIMKDQVVPLALARVKELGR